MKRSNLILVCAGAFLTTNAFAGVIIDGFNAPCANFVSTSTSANSGFSCPGSLGGSRNDSLSVTPSTGLSSTISANPPNGAISANIASQSAAIATLLWDGGTDSTNSFGLVANLTLGGADGITVRIQSDLVGTIQIVLWTSGSQFSSLTMATPGAGFNSFTSIFFPFASFAATGGGTSASSVNALSATITGPQSMDWVIDDISSTTSVPEPSSTMLIGGGLFALVSLRRRSRRLTQ